MKQCECYLLEWVLISQLFSKTVLRRNIEWCTVFKLFVFPWSIWKKMHHRASGTKDYTNCGTKDSTNTLLQLFALFDCFFLTSNFTYLATANVRIHAMISRHWNPCTPCCDIKLVMSCSYVGYCALLSTTDISLSTDKKYEFTPLILKTNKTLVS